MARSERGRELTALERVRANARAQALAKSVEKAFDEALDPADIEAGRSRFISRATARTLAVAETQRSATVAYLGRYARAESGQLTITYPILTAEQIATQLTIGGPVAFKAAIGRGYAPEHALAYARTRASMVARGIVLDTQRRTITGTARASRGRWRRVTDGHPCAFCAMLASRGPVYAEDTVDFEAHSKCGCTAEISFETADEWVRQYATDTELAWINAYFDAAETASRAGQPRVAPVRKAGKGRDTVLARMRRQHPDLFHDGVKSPL